MVLIGFNWLGSWPQSQAGTLENLTQEQRKRTDWWTGAPPSPPFASLKFPLPWFYKRWNILLIGLEKLLELITSKVKDVKVVVALETKVLLLFGCSFPWKIFVGVFVVFWQAVLAPLGAKRGTLVYQRMYFC